MILICIFVGYRNTHARWGLPCSRAGVVPSGRAGFSRTTDFAEAAAPMRVAAGPASPLFYDSSMPMPVLEQLQGAGLRATLPRVKVLEFFAAARPRHVSAEDVFRHLMAEKIDIGLATVYRVLSQFVEAGILTSGTLDGNRHVFELNDGKRHDHIICLSCGKVDEFSDPLIDGREKAAADALGYLLTGHHLVLHGYCADCRPKQRPAPGEAALAGAAGHEDRQGAG